MQPLPAASNKLSLYCEGPYLAKAKAYRKRRRLLTLDDFIKNSNNYFPTIISNLNKTKSPYLSRVTDAHSEYAVGTRDEEKTVFK